ncbi:peptidylprolyl isomerase [Mycolicibacterium sediminis]|uniref:Cyclophilin n=1 Tax=Mycolicibacterium sediminis TaxID=1286180 RepID=A0A7I7QU96_9MYCO|nr:peptidylprolyl isomerase [Mycolicibacterium sediminis]BBY29590.1 cyclophilin [Mycolicibacterium sediminis]
MTYNGYEHGYGYGPPPPRGTNGLAVASLICAFLFAPLGILFGHMSLSQIKRTGEDGHGLAVAGLIIGYVVTVLGALVLVATILLASFAIRSVDDWNPNRRGQPGQPGGQAIASALPPFDPPATLGSNCQYPATTEPAAKPATPPRTGQVPTVPSTVAATIDTSDGPIGLLLDNAQAPCTVNNFVSLAQQGFYDGTTCHRLATSAQQGLLQCGDPTGTGRGGPGYRFPNEYPTNQYRITDPALNQPVVYPRGTLAMANVGPGTNGSQFYLVYEDSTLPPAFTVFGAIDDIGLQKLDDIAAAGVADGSDDGAPRQPVTIESVRMDP